MTKYVCILNHVLIITCFQIIFNIFLNWNFQKSLSSDKYMNKFLWIMFGYWSVLIKKIQEYNDIGHDVKKLKLTFFFVFVSHLANLPTFMNNPLVHVTIKETCICLTWLFLHACSTIFIENQIKSNTNAFINRPTGTRYSNSLKYTCLDLFSLKNFFIWWKKRFILQLFVLYDHTYHNS